MSNFLPKGYKAPAGSSDFMKLEEGSNRFRVLAEAVIGWEGWKDNKPFRREGIDQNIDNDEVDIDPKYKKPKLKHIWVFPVFDYQDEKVKILEISQKTIMKAIQAIVEDPDWGDPVKYDLSIEKVDGNRVSYSVKPFPPKPLSKNIATAYKESKVDVMSIFREINEDDEAEEEAEKKFKNYK